MRILFYQWEAFMQRDMELALKRAGIVFDVFRFPYKEKHSFEEFRRKIRKKLLKGDYQAVFSMNYREEVALGANECGIPYLAWIVDSPFGISQNIDILKLKTNYVFIFDRRDYQRLVDRGVKTIYHLPLAVNVERLDQLELSPEDHERFDADVSLVGALYPSTYPGFRSRLTDEEASFVETVIAKQQAQPGRFILDELTNDENMLRDIQTTLEGNWQGYDFVFHESLQSLLAKEATRRDRMMLLLCFSEFYQTALYSNKKEELLEKVDFRGTVDSFEELFKVYKASKINLCVTYYRIASGIPLRALEVMGAGGFLLSNYQTELAESFRPDIDCVMYENVEEAIDKVTYYMTHDEERMRIAENGHESAKRFTYDIQLSKMLAITGLNEG